jgi:antitoxin VapB
MMSTEQKTTVFMNGRTQAVRIPAHLRFKGKQVYIRRDPHTGDLVLTEMTKRRSLKKLLEDIARDPFPEDFLADRNQGTYKERESL